MKKRIFSPQFVKGELNAPHLEQVLRCLYLLRCASDGDDAVLLAGQRRVDLDLGATVEANLLDARATAAHYRTCHLLVRVRYKYRGQ